MADTPQFITARASERQLQELIHGFLKSYFNGQPHTSLLGNVTFPVCDLFYNQADIGTPDANPQIHTIFLTFRSQEVWWGGGPPSTWLRFLCAPTGGVAYGETTDFQVQETIHGRVIRTLAGTAIQWQDYEDGLHEQVLNPGGWNDVRIFAGATAIQWLRDGSQYTEQVMVAGVWTTTRVILGNSPVWDGTVKQVQADATIAQYIRTKNFGGGDNSTDFLCRSVADNVKELYQSAAARRALGLSGIRHWQLLRGPTPIMSAGFQTRMLTISAQLQYLVPWQA